MSMHREQWAALGTKIKEHVFAHQLAYSFVAVAIFFLLLGRYSAN